MKKTFRTILAGAVALLAVSCYDDSDLRGQLGDLDERLDKVEATLNAETGGIADLLGRIETLAGQIAAIKVETDAETGLTTLTLSDGSSVALSKNGVLTIVDGGWATVAANGTVTPLGIKVDHPKLAFKVEGGELKVSYDGTTYEATGVKVSEYTAHVIGNVVVAEDGKSVTVKIGDKNLELPLVSSAVATLGLSRDSFFLRYEAEKVINITAENLSDIYVMNQPDGWNAVIKDNDLTITSPTKKATEIGAAQKEGLVLLHATDEDGKCVVAKLAVTAGPGLTLAIDAKGNITIENSFASMQPGTGWDPEPYFGFDAIVFGFATPDAFNDDPEAYVEHYNSTWETPDFGLVLPQLSNAGVAMGTYIEGQYETDVINTSIDEIWQGIIYEDYPIGQPVVLWAAPADAENQGKPIVEDMVYVNYMHQKYEVEVKEASHNDIVLSLNVAGASAYIINCVEESYYNREDDPKTFDDYMLGAMGGPWTGFVQYGMREALGAVFTPEELLPSEGETAKEIRLSQILKSPLLFGEKYKIWVMPVFDHKSVLDEEASMPEEDFYCYDNSAHVYEKDFLPYVITQETKDLEAGAAQVTYELVSSSYDAIGVKVTLPEGIQSVYYYWYSIEDYSEFGADSEIVSDIVSRCFFPLTASEQIDKNYISPGDEFMLVCMSVSADGKYAVKAEKFSSKPAPLTSDITVTKLSLKDDGTNYVLEVAVTGATKVMGYAITASETALAEFVKKVTLNGHKASYNGYEMAAVVDGKATLTFEKNSYKANYYVAGLNVAENLVSAISANQLLINLSEAESVTPAN